MANHCLVCGDQRTGKKYVLDQLIGPNIDLKSIANNRNECTWNISNKYYECDVTLTIINCKDLLSHRDDDHEDGDDLKANAHLSQAQFSAIILVLNLNKPRSVVQTQLEDWMRALSPYLSSSDCNLFCANYTRPFSAVHDAVSDPGQQKKFHQHLHNLCVDYCFEFVPSPHTCASHAEENELNNFYGLKSSLFDNYDKPEMGHTRIASALQCVMWPNMTRARIGTKPKSITSVTPLLKHDDDADADGLQLEEDMFRKHDQVTVTGLHSKPHWNGRVAEIVGPFSHSRKRWPVQLMEQDGDEEEKEVGVVPKVLLQTKNLVLKKKGPRWTQTHEDVVGEAGLNSNSHVEEKEEEKVEVEVAIDVDGDGALENKIGSFETLIEEMQQVRTAAKSGKLSTERRRQRAADAAMKLMSYMGLDQETPHSDDSDHDHDKGTQN